MAFQELDLNQTNLHGVCVQSFNDNFYLAQRSHSAFVSVFLLDLLENKDRKYGNLTFMSLYASRLGKERILCSLNYFLSC